MKKTIDSIELITSTEQNYYKYNYEVTITQSDREIEYFCKNSNIYFIFEIPLDVKLPKLHITEFHTEPINTGLGSEIFSYMLSIILNECQTKGYKEFTITGKLSNIDEANGHWPGSLIAYKKLSSKFHLDFYITDITDYGFSKDMPNQLKKKKYYDIYEFYNPEKGKINSGIFHYASTTDIVTNALNTYQQKKQEGILRIEDRRQAEREYLRRILTEKEKTNPITGLIKGIFGFFKY